jgi:hypothetical protein
MNVKLQFSRKVRQPGPTTQPTHHLTPLNSLNMSTLTYLMLLLFSAPYLTNSALLRNVKEIEGFLTVTEKADLKRVKKHAQLWAQELLMEKDKLITLTAAQKIRELALLTSTLEDLTNYTSTQDNTPNSNIQNQKETWGDNVHVDRTWTGNQVRRQKRNILGDLVHVITGLATDDMLQQQLKIDEVIRDKVTNTLARQISFEQTMATIYSNLSKEEETMHSMLYSLQFQHEQDKARLTRMTAYQSVVLEDIDRLEDQIEAVWTGQANTRHAVFLSSRAGLSQVAAFTYISTVHSTDLQLKYSARMYTNTPIKKITYTPGILHLDTMDKSYLLHPAYDLGHPITELEVRGTKADCPQCAKLVHAGQGNYIVVQSGQLTCQRGDLPEDISNVTAGQQISIHKPSTCWNQLITVGGSHLRLKDFNIDTADDQSLDLLLVHKVTKEDVKMESPADIKTTHTLLNLKLRHDLQEAKEDMSNFIVDTSLEISKGELSSTISWGWMAAISGVIAIFLVLIIVKILRNCKTSQTT